MSLFLYGFGTFLFASALPMSFGSISYGRDVLPIFSEKCFQCHGPDQNQRKGGLRLDTRAGATKKADGFAAVTPGDPTLSSLISRIEDDDIDEVMPPPETGLTLSTQEKSMLREWILNGAQYEQHWAFQVPQKNPPPREGHPIDAFVSARLERNGLSFSPPANSETLCRRLYLDLIGLPPSPEQMTNFARAAKVDRKKAVEDLTTRLMKNPAYGERWARPWLDVARYADSNGFEKDVAREQWAWRDWVIESINKDQPYNEFLIEQIAGDLIPNRTQDQLVATGFLRNGMVNEEGAIIPEQFRVEGIFDRMDCVGKSVLGLSLQCAQCHSHKFDPISHDEYYGMFAFLNDTHEAQSWVYTEEQLEKINTIQSRVANLEESIKTKHPDWQQAIAVWEADERSNQPLWNVLDFSEHVWEGGLNHPTKLSDRSILVLGHPSAGGSMYLVSRPGETTIREIRIEALRHGDLPFDGPGRGRTGLFSIAEIEVYQRKNEDADWLKVELAKAQVDFATDEREIDHGPDKEKRPRIGPASFLIDGQLQTGWMPDRGPVRRHTDAVAIVTPTTPLTFHESSELKIRLQLHRGKVVTSRDNLQLGRLRCSIAETSLPKRPVLDHAAWLAISKPKAARTKEDTEAIFRAWRQSQPELAQTNALIDEQERTYPEAVTSVLHLAMPPDGLRRTTRLLDRGVWDRPKHTIQAHTPAALHRSSSKLETRLDFARWLVSAESPLTARVQVNRIWQAIFGVGLVKTAEDFGTRAPRPEYQDLLDWLSVDFVEQGWRMKPLIRTIVSSQVYQQDSRIRPEIHELDPENHLLSRGPRFRVDAEVVRDIALSLSGLLNQRLGGPSFYPPVPKSMLDYNYVRMNWPEADAPERYRRSLYMFRKRSMPDPVLTSFDAPNADFACARRPRSNTPLAALVPLNEPIFIEAARALALRILHESGPDDESRVDFGIQLCTGIPPAKAEREALLAFLAEQRTRLAEGWLTISHIAFGEGDSPPPELPANTTPQDMAAWAITARVLLNMDATLTKN